MSETCQMCSAVVDEEQAPIYFQNNDQGRVKEEIIKIRNRKNHNWNQFLYFVLFCVVFYLLFYK